MSYFLRCLTLGLLFYYIYKKCPYLVRIAGLPCLVIWANKLFLAFLHLIQSDFIGLFGIFSYLLGKLSTTCYTFFFSACIVRLWLCEKFNKIRNAPDFKTFGTNELSETKMVDIEEIVPNVNAQENVKNNSLTFPNGWIPLLESMELPKGETKPVFALGKAFALFRGMNGKAYVLDAYCPHLGANLAIGGKVNGNCIECPFHMWRFNGEDGVCVNVPYASKTPQGVKAGTWLSDEKNGIIYVWYHIGGEQPSWHISEIPEIKAKSFTYGGRVDSMVPCHIKDASVHAMNTIFVSSARSHSHIPDANTYLQLSIRKYFQSLNSAWDKFIGSEESKINNATLKSCNFKMNFNVFPMFDAEFTGEMKQFGPMTSILHGKSKLADFIVVQAFIPEKTYMTKIIQRFYFRTLYPQLLTNIIINRFDKAFYRNYESIPIELEKQLLKEENSDLKKKYKHWYSQFYLKNEEKLETVTK